MLNDWESLPSMKLKASEGIDDFMEVIFLRLSVTSLLWLAFHGFCVRSRNQNFAGLCWMADDSMMLWTAVSLLIQCLEWDHELQALNPAVLCPIDTRKNGARFLLSCTFSNQKKSGCSNYIPGFENIINVKILIRRSLYLLDIHIGEPSTLRILVKDRIFISREDIKNF